MNKIRNYEELISCGDAASRKLVLELTDRVLKRLDSYDRIKSMMYLDGDILHVGSRCWDLSKKKSVYVLGAGKACNQMAMAVTEILGDRVTKGVINVKFVEETDRYVNTEVYVGGHPLPNAEGERALL